MSVHDKIARFKAAQRANRRAEHKPSFRRSGHHVTLNSAGRPLAPDFEPSAPPPDHEEWKRSRKLSNEAMRRLLNRRRRFITDRDPGDETE